MLSEKQIREQHRTDLASNKNLNQVFILTNLFL